MKYKMIKFIYCYKTCIYSITKPYGLETNNVAKSYVMETAMSHRSPNVSSKSLILQQALTNADVSSRVEF